MERRLVLFVVLSTLAPLANMVISSLLFPCKAPVAKKDDGAAKVEQPADDEKPVDEKPANGETGRRRRGTR